MVERKKNEKEKKTVQIKATAGAWWKSKPSEVKEETTTQSAKEVKEEVKESKPKRAPRPRKTAATKTPRKTTRSSSKTKIETDFGDVSLSKDAAEDVDAPKQTSRKKATPKAKATKPRTSRAKKAAPTEKKIVAATPLDESASTDVSDQGKAVSDAIETEPEKKATKPRRGRRPKAAVKKETAVESEKEGSAEPKDATKGQSESDSLEVTAEDKSVEKTKTPKPRRGRRPRTAAAKKGVADKKEDDDVKLSETDDSGSIVVSEKVVATDAAENKEESISDASVTKDGEESAPGETKKPKPRRGRRPKAASQKDTPKETPESADTSGDGSIDGDDGEAGEDKKESSKRPTSKKVEEEPQEEVKKVCKLLINAEEPEECRLALLEDGRLESINVSTISKTQRKNNIYKARIVAIEPSLQAAFVEYGTDKNGFLPFSEIHPEYFKQELPENIQHLVDTQQWKKLSITDVVERGQDILAQVVKEEVGKKGANMTTYLSIPGRCVVLMPGSDSAGISRKISGEQRRSQLRDTMKSMELPEGIGWIVRTASVDITQEDLTRDVGFLLKLWEDIKGKGQNLEGVGLVYEEQDSVLRILREHFDPSIREILVDDREALEQVKDFVQMLPKDQQSVTVRLHQGA